MKYDHTLERIDQVKEFLSGSSVNHLSDAKYIGEAIGLLSLLQDILVKENKE